MSQKIIIVKIAAILKGFQFFFYNLVIATVAVIPIFTLGGSAMCVVVNERMLVFLDALGSFNAEGVILLVVFGNASIELMRENVAIRG